MGIMRRPAGAATLLALPSLLAAASAQAGLGEKLDSIARDHQSLRAQSESVARMPAYERHEMVTADGVRIREYAADGTVFAVTWSGPVQPDLKIVLGNYYRNYRDAAARHSSGHHVLTVSNPEIHLQILRLQRGFVGSARIPALLPAGVTPSDIQ